MKFISALLLLLALAALGGGAAVANAATVSIDYGAKYVRGVNVWVDFDADYGDKYYRISNSSDFTGLDWQETAYASPLDWVLDSVEGTRTVYMQFASSLDDATPTTAQDSVVLDMGRPISKLVTRTVKGHRFNRVYFSTYDSATRVITELRVNGRYMWSNGYSDKALANGTHSFRWYCSLRRGTYTVKIYAHDRGGNVQPWRRFSLRVK